MKEYFVVETDEICELGDVLNLTFSKDTEDGRVIVEKEVKVTEFTLGWLSDMGLIQEREMEEEDNNSFSDEEDCCKELSDLMEDVATLEYKTSVIEDMVKEIYTTLKSPSKKKTAQSKKEK